MDSTMIDQTERFLKSTFSSSEFLQKNPAVLQYRLEHSYRVANIAKVIAAQEGFDVTAAVIAGLLHDIAYCEEMNGAEVWQDHGRRSAAIARPFLESLALSTNTVNEICYGIAIHVDDNADFEWERTAFSETIGDADNIDRFDTYRIYETLQYDKFSEMPLAEKRDYVLKKLDRLHQLREMKLGTATAKEVWLERLAYYISFYERLSAQLAKSCSIY